MKVYGYQKNSDDLIELNEVSIMGDIEELEKLVNYFKHVLDEHGKVSDDTEMCHSHIRDWDDKWDDNQPDIIVVTTNEK
ncbi:hypothetical protein [Fusibacter sp. JL216-2]|uniref:hypothetical protein n=1 Tax=Fusibacter sp. JL216-2 TaxID=3071453 RepID=UPI003D325768